MKTPHTRFAARAVSARPASLRPAHAPLILFASIALLSTTAFAKPVGPGMFCDVYPDAPACSGQVTSCSMCHTAPPGWNSYGIAVLGALTGTFETTLPEALAAIETEDSDGDGVTNLVEIMLGTYPGNADDSYTIPLAPTGDENPSYAVGTYDDAFAYKRMKASFCGRSPTFEEMEAFTAAADKAAFIDDALDVCLQTTHWKNETLHRLADAKVRPLEAVGTGPAAVIPLADYEWDYRLFSYVLTDDRDARELLTADYHVDEGGNVVTGPIIDGDFGQPLLPQYRAGMITTQWFLMIHTMFSDIPRTTAAQAYRAYLGQDIARSEGILPVAGEPLDVDGKGVAQTVCAYCHSTLDPLAYAFAYYEGIEGGDTGTFNAGRPNFAPTDVSASLLGQPLTDIDQHGVVEWGALASESDLFQRSITEMFMVHALGAVTPYEEPFVRELYETMPVDNYSANKLIHRLVDSDAFGVP
jgi:hypothetical protein